MDFLDDVEVDVRCYAGDEPAVVCINRVEQLEIVIAQVEQNDVLSDPLAGGNPPRFVGGCIRRLDSYGEAGREGFCDGAFRTGVIFAKARVDTGGGLVEFEVPTIDNESVTEQFDPSTEFVGARTEVIDGGIEYRSKQRNEDRGELAVKGLIREVVPATHGYVPLEKCQYRLIRTGAKSERQLVKHGSNIQFSLSFHEIHRDGRVAQLVWAKHSCDAIDNYRIGVCMP